MERLAALAEVKLLLEGYVIGLHNEKGSFTSVPVFSSLCEVVFKRLQCLLFRLPIPDSIFH